MHYPPPEDIASFHTARTELVTLAHHMIDVLSALRMSRINGAVCAPYLPPSAPAIIKDPSDKHELRWQGGMWICMKCLYRSSSSSGLSKVPCRRHPAMTKLLLEDLGHKLWTSPLHGGGFVVYCSVCWNYASAYPRLLLQPCVKPRLGFRPCSRFHLVNRRHPRSRARVLCPCRLHV